MQGVWLSLPVSMPTPFSLFMCIAFSSSYSLLLCYLQGAFFCHLSAIVFRWGKGQTSFLPRQGLLKQSKLQTLHRMYPLFSLLLCFSLMIALPQVLPMQLRAMQIKLVSKTLQLFYLKMIGVQEVEA